MSEFKGTRGSYKVGRKSTKNNDGRYQCYVSNGKIIDSPVCTVFGKTDIECDANALLISKAPEMLEMLKILLKEFKAVDVRTGVIKEDLKQLIKEATEL